MGWIHSEAATISPLFRFRAPLIFILLRSHASRALRAARIIGQVDAVPSDRWSADALPSAARRTCLLGINGGEQLLHGARRRCAERLIKVDRLCKLLADEVIAPREFAVARECLLNAIGVAAAQRPRRMPRQQGFDLVSLFLIHSQPRSIPFALRSEEGTWIARQCPGMARLPLMHQSSKTRRGRGATKRDGRAQSPPVNPKMFGNDLTCSPNTPCQHPAL